MMGFFLLVRSAEGTLRLLSEQTFESRQDALAELSRITADPTFDAWDDEVILLDADAGTPVLLLRPAGAETPELEPETAVTPIAKAEPLPQPAAFAALADEELVVTPIGIPAPASESPVAIETTPESDVRAAPVAVEPPGGSKVEVADQPEAFASQSSTSLRDAIARTTEHMEATGIVAPASIGLAAVASAAAPVTQPKVSPGITRPAPEPVLGTAMNDEAAHTPVVAADEPPDAEVPTADEEVAPEAVLEADAGPEILGEIEPAAAPAANPSLPEPAVPAWPWDTPIAEPASVDQLAAPASEDVEDPSVAYVLDGLEDPSIDDGGSLITASADLDGPDLARPVILGAYDESPFDGIKPRPHVDGPTTELDVTEPAATGRGDEAVALTDAPEAQDAPDAAVPSQAFAAPMSEREAPASGEPQPTSDFFSLDTPSSARSEPGADVPPLSSYTCSDCVYVDTCPNRDQRLPKDCGSFQWK